MKLESLVKYYSPRSPKLDDGAPATGGDELTITDVLAAQGMVSVKARIGFDLFLAKMGVQKASSAIQHLIDYVMALKNPVLMKHPADLRIEIAGCLATFAFNDYSRSAASKSVCPYCNGSRIVKRMKDVLKHPGVRGIPPNIKKECVEDLCFYCEGKGVISAACRDCHGRGLVMDKKRTELHLVPVKKLCGRCNGKGYSRLPTTLIKGRVLCLVPDMTNYQWYNGYAQVIDQLITKCWQEESYAESQLNLIVS